MKTRLISMLMVLALLLGLLPTALAADPSELSGTCGDTITWTLDPVEGLLTIDGEGQIPDYSYSEGAPWYAYRSRIFRAVLTGKIDGIGAYAFNECAYLTKLDASCPMTYIGAGACNNCAALETVTFAPTQHLCVGEEAFFGCASLKCLDLAAEDGEIGAGAFSGCVALETLTLPEKLARLERETFAGCAALTALSLPENLTYIGKSCFRGCTGLTALSFPEALATIERYAFSSCDGIRLSFTGTPPELASALDLSASFPLDAVLEVPYEVEGWSWPLYKGYSVQYDYPDLEDTFSDLVKDAWYIPSVQHVYFAGLMNGMQQDKFSPQNPMTRAQLVTVLYRMAGEPEVTTENPFTDIAETAYYYNAVRWAQNNGIVTGLTATTFGPNAHVTRQQMCTILYRYAAKLELPLTQRKPLTDFTDADQLADYARDPMSWCVAVGFINGKPGNLLDPLGTATRAEIAKVLTAFDTFLAVQEALAKDNWADIYSDQEPLPEINREDPLYLYAQEVFDTINQKRTDNGLSELQWSDRVFIAAQTRAEELSGENSFGHTRPDGTNYATVFNQFRIESSTRNEIIAHGYTSAKDLVDVWATANATSPVISAVVYSSGAVGVYQLPPEEEGKAGRYYYALLVIG